MTEKSLNEIKADTDMTNLLMIQFENQRTDMIQMMKQLAQLRLQDILKLKAANEIIAEVRHELNVFKKRFEEDK